MTENYEQKLRKKILERLEDLKEKIEKNEDFPESKQDINSLAYIDESLEEILNNWYY